MPELPDQPIDADIARTLKFNTRVTPAQREDARARLLRCAAEQTILPPAPVSAAVVERATLRDHADTFRQQGMRFLRFLLVDSTCYERARRPPTFFQYYNAHGRGAFTIIQVSA
nr:hypothetical protein [uncultured bacterium]